MDIQDELLPAILAGPLLRHASPRELVVWLVTSRECELVLQCRTQGTLLQQRRFTADHSGQVRIGSSAWIHLLTLYPDEPLPQHQWLEYDIGLVAGAGESAVTQWLCDTVPELCYATSTRPDFVIKPELDTVLHGSCRKPHHADTDGLTVVDQLLAQAREADRTVVASPGNAANTAAVGATCPADVAMPASTPANLCRGVSNSASTSLTRGVASAASEAPTSAAARTSSNAPATDSPPSRAQHDQHQATADGVQPALLMLHGDQIYADDVAGPMLLAIHQVIDLLGLYDETIPGLGAAITGQTLYEHPDNLYRRMHLLPDTANNATLVDTLFGGARKPVFSSANADNHLISLAEVLGMYLLVWSPALWPYVSLEAPRPLSEEHQQRYAREQQHLQGFINTLPQVRRALAHVPVYMIFDDHDISDDWNLSKEWEQSAYGHPFSRRIIGNALIGYLLCQGWGNAPQKFSDGLIERVRESVGGTDAAQRDALIDTLLGLHCWHYTLNTQPKLVVLDSRTRRWPSDRHDTRPSGLMDAVALAELADELLDESAVLLVSSAPIFGVKLIEVVQRVCAWCGYALTIDAENWMSHRGAAKSILDIFEHARTPQTFVIMSGDVHYSFVYDVRLRKREESPHIWQITSSGIKNTFPSRLLRRFDRSNRWLFSGRSPLNWFTRRRHMHIRPRRPSPHTGRYRHQRLYNGNGIGLITLNAQGEPIKTAVCTVDGQQVEFADGYDTDWH